MQSGSFILKTLFDYLIWIWFLILIDGFSKFESNYTDMDNSISFTDNSMSYILSFGSLCKQFHLYIIYICQDFLLIDYIIA